jgi:hypothetical protein
VLNTRRTGHDEVNSKRSPDEEDGEEEIGGGSGSGSWRGDGEDGEKKPLPLPPPPPPPSWMCIGRECELMLLWMLL